MSNRLGRADPARQAGDSVARGRESCRGEPIRFVVRQVRQALQQTAAVGAFSPYFAAAWATLPVQICFTLRIVSPGLTGEHVSCRTYVPMIACLVIPGFELRVALRERPRLQLAPAALSPDPGPRRCSGR